MKKELNIDTVSVNNDGVISGITSKPLCNCDDLQQGSIIRLTEDGYCSVCGKNWNWNCKEKTTPNTTKEVEELKKEFTPEYLSSFDSDNLLDMEELSREIVAVMQRLLTTLTAKHEAEKREIYESLDANYKIIVEHEKEKAVESERERIEQAHMAGYYSCCQRDASYSEARNYFDKLTPTKTDNE